MQYLSVAMVGTNDIMVSVTRTPLRDVTDCWSTPFSVASSVTSKSAVTIWGLGLGLDARDWGLGIWGWWIEGLGVLGLVD